MDTENERQAVRAALEEALRELDRQIAQASTSEAGVNRLPSLQRSRDKLLRKQRELE